MIFLSRSLKIDVTFQALEDVHLKNRPALQDVLYYMDRIFTVVFFLEMCVKWLALGFVKYFTNAWCWLDFVIVMVNIFQSNSSNPDDIFVMLLIIYPFSSLSFQL